jgi:tetratricopeptide (TPR) repeat protein
MDNRADTTPHPAGGAGNLVDVGVTAGGDVNLTGTYVAGRDLHVHQAPPEVEWSTIVPSQLPRGIPDFVGRDQDFRRVRKLLVHEDGQDEQRTVVISAIAGKGGVGKTALAVEVAHALRPQFPDGQLFINLGGAGPVALDPADVLVDFLRVYGIVGAGVPKTLEERARLYRSCLAGRRVLVVLDNAESEAQVRPLLPGSGTCAVLITSRTRLTALEGVQPVILDVLEADQAVALLSGIIGEERVANEKESAYEIARLCGYLPLAVRIAGARLAARDHWPLRKLAGRLGEERRRLSELNYKDLEVRAMFSLSYERREEGERRVFRLLGLLEAPDFPAWVIAPMTDLDPTRAEELIERLADAQLLEVVGPDLAGQTRYRFHDLVRVFARERLEDEEPEEVRRSALERVLTAYLNLAQAAEDLLEPGSQIGAYVDGAPRWTMRQLNVEEMQPATGYGWFMSERASLVAAIGQAYRDSMWRLTWQLADAAVGFFAVRAYWNDWENTQTMALLASQRGDDRYGEAIANRNLGRLYKEQSRWGEALDCFERAMAVFEEVGDRAAAAVTRRHLGRMYYYQGRHAEAIARFEEALEAFRELGDRRREAITIRDLGMASREQGQLQEARAYLERCLVTFQELQDRRWVAGTSVSLGDVYGDLGRLDEAIEQFEVALPIFVEVGDRRWEAVTRVSLGAVHRVRGDLDAAERHLNDARPIYHELGDHLWEAKTVWHLAEVKRAQRRDDEAAELLRLCLATFQELGDTYWVERAESSLAALDPGSTAHVERQGRIDRDQDPEAPS